MAAGKRKSFPEKVREIKDKDLVSVAFMEMTLLEISWYLRGMENFMLDMLDNPDIVNYFLDRACEIMMMSPENYREFIKPRLQKIIKTAKDIKPDM